jgi:hypothetical protein
LTLRRIYMGCLPSVLLNQRSPKKNTHYRLLGLR